MPEEPKKDELNKEGEKLDKIPSPAPPPAQPLSEEPIKPPLEEPAESPSTEPAKPPAKEEEKKEFLLRGEIKTMQKDISHLQEGEAKTERERIAKLKTAEEETKEKEKQERALKQAEARKIAEEEAKKKEEESKGLREERKQKEKLMEKEISEKKELKAEAFKERAKTTQEMEEEDRKRFLERVAAKAEGKEEPQPAPPAPSPAPPSAPPSPPKPFVPEKIKKLIPLDRPAKILKPLFKRPSFAQKLWIRIVLSILALAILAAIGTFWYWYFVVRERPVVEEEPIAEEPIVEEITIAPAKISVEADKTLRLSSPGELSGLISQTLQGYLGEDRFTRILIEDVEAKKIWGINEFFEGFGIEPPEDFYNKIEDDFTLFIYSIGGNNRLGFIAATIEDLSPLLKSWEPTIEKDFEDLFILLGKTGPAPTPGFKEASYKDVFFRYLSFPPENFGICWALTDNYLIFTSSGTSLIRTIDKIK